MDADKHIPAFVMVLLVGVGLFLFPLLASEAERSEVYIPYTVTNHEKLEVDITFYTSRPEETDSTPFITADGTRVRDGIIAISRDLFEHFDYGDSLFVDGYGWFEVRDCMNKRWKKRVDIWVGSKKVAIRNGKKRGNIRWNYSSAVKYWVAINE